MNAKLCLWIFAVGLIVTVASEETEEQPCAGDECDRTADGSPDTPPDAPPARRHQEACTPAEKKEAGCLHGECFSIYLGGSSRSLSCRCHKLYEGLRCEQICSECYIRAMEEENRRAQLNLYLGIGVPAAALVIIILAVIIYKCVRWRQRKNRERQMYKAVTMDTV